MTNRWLALLAAATVVVVAPALAQVTTSCNPMNKTCPNDPALGTTHFWNFTTEPDSSVWKQKVRGVTFDPKLGATFAVSKQGDSPTLQSNFYFFWGRTEMMLRCAPGTGIISSMMWLSDDLDEVDFEFMGVHPNQAASNYFGKGVEDFNNGGYHNTTFNNQDDFHNYTVDWTADYLKWYIDGALVRTLLPADANNSYYFPQTPMTFNIGIWAGGDSSLPQGTIDWAGGRTDYDAGPYHMYVQSVKVTDYSNHSNEYEFIDRSGMASGVNIINGTSDVVSVIDKQPDKSLSEKFASLSTGAKAGIFAGAGSVAIGALAAALFYFIKQRQRGAAEAAAAAEKAAEESRLEAEAVMAARGINPDSFAGKTGADYDQLANNDTSYYGQESMPNTPVNASGPLDGYGRPTMSGLAVGGAARGLAAAGSIARPQTAQSTASNPFRDQNRGGPFPLYQEGGISSPTTTSFAGISGNGSAPQSPAGRSEGRGSPGFRGYGPVDSPGLHGSDSPIQLQNRGGHGFSRQGGGEQI